MAGRIDYAERQEQKKELYQERLEQAEQRSQVHYENQRKISSAIPMGQPILIGHHSEKRHRNDLKKIDNEMRKSIQESEKADYYRNKIDNIDNSKAISSDDPQAIEKLQARIEKLEKAKVEVKARPHEWYELPYLNADIRRCKDRIKEIQELEELQFEDVTFTGGKAILNREINRLQFIFDAIPDEETRTTLKKHGFKWSRYEQAWQRLYNKNGIYAVRYVIEKINERGEENDNL